MPGRSTVPRGREADGLMGWPGIQTKANKTKGRSDAERRRVRGLYTVGRQGRSACGERENAGYDQDG
jgi:hypothetical protein